jgi:hypothetical protein
MTASLREHGLADSTDAAVGLTPIRSDNLSRSRE